MNKNAPLKRQTRLNLVRHILFWSWNAIFIAVVHVGILPFIGPDILYGLKRATINYDVAAFFAALILLPVVSIFSGFLFLRQDSRKLFHLLYCIELPLLSLTVFRVSLLREVTWGVGFFLTLFALSSFTFVKRLLISKSSPSVCNVVLSTITLWCGTWVFVQLCFLIPPLASSVWDMITVIVHGLLQGNISPLFTSFFGFFIILLGSLFILFTSTLFVLFPFVYIHAALSTWWTTLRPLYRLHRLKAIGLTVSILIAITAVFCFTTNQSHEPVLMELRDYSGSKDERIHLEKNERAYKAALRDAYLAPYRYLGDFSQTNFLQTLYEKSFGLSPAKTLWIQWVFNHVARPFIYRGTANGMAHDQKLAERLYSELFDSSIQEEERESIRHAVQATFSREQISAGLLNIDDRRVHLDHQEVTLIEDGELAQLDLHEVYFNPSDRPEEVVLHMKLPSGAVITDAWLSDDETKKYRGRISPRGAAQKVYREIVRQGEDPALIEQVGPDLYRLKVFPVPANRDLRKSNRLHFWLSLRMIKQNDLNWKLPLLTERRNLYWDGSTEFILNGVRRENEDAWLPREITQKQSSAPLSLAAHVGDTRFRLEPLDPNTISPRCSLAVLVDPSYSMRNKRDEMIQVKEAIDQHCEHQGVSTYFWINGPVRVEGDFKEELRQHVFSGTFDAADLTRPILSRELGEKTVILLTDRSFFRENEYSADPKRLDRPTWFLLLDQHYPRSINDSLLKRLYEIGGGIETDWESILKASAHQEYKASHKDVIDVDERYIWRISKTDKDAPETPLLAPLFTHKQILDALKRGHATDLAELDKLQKLAAHSSVVSPFSSLIVLINEAQIELLKKAEKGDDRFNRQVETGKELLSTPHAPFETTAVPEPEEWALLLVILSFLLLNFYQNRKGAGAKGGGAMFRNRVTTHQSRT